MSAEGPAPALSIVVPVYNEEGNVAALHAELTEVARGLGQPYEIVFVNDGSRDTTLDRLSAIAADDPNLRIVDLDGNFGEAAALSAGFAHARGHVVVTLDGDGQNDPHDIPRLLALLERGYDVVSGRRLTREEPFVTRVLPSKIANALIARATGVPVYDCGCGLKAYRRHVVAGAQLPRGMNRFLPAILGVDPARVAEVPTKDRPRGSGTSHYGLSRVAIVFRDLLSLRLLVRRPPPGRAVAWLAGAMAVVFAAFALAAAGAAVLRSNLQLTLAAVGGVVAAAVTAAMAYNVARCVDAREHGVFRVGRVLHGKPSSEHRHRGRGLLGQEPAPNLRSSAGGTRH